MCSIRSLCRSVVFVPMVFVPMLALGGPLAAETVSGWVYRDLDGDGVRAPEEPAIAAARILVYDIAGRMVAQGSSGADGGFRLDLDAPAGTTVRLTVTGLGGRAAVVPTPEGAIELSGGAADHRVDLRLLDASPRPGDLRTPAAAIETLTHAAAADTAAPRVAGAADLGFPNVGPWVTLRCAGVDGVFDLGSATDDAIETSLAETPEQAPTALAGIPYHFGTTPQVGERCRVYTPGEIGAVPPP